MGKYINIKSATNPRSTSTGGIMIDVTIEGFDGVKQFHAVPWDPEEHGRDLYQRAIDGEFGEVAEYVPPVLTVEAKAAIATQAVHQHLDTQAQAFGYDDIKSACSYADEPAVPKFQAEGIAFRKWRSLVWEYYYAVLAAVAAGDRSEPTVEGLIAELPALDMLAS